MIPGSKDNAHLRNVDLLRGFAIILVFAFHTQEHLVEGYRISAPSSFGLEEGVSLNRILLNLVPSAFGWSGVDLFLLISGFLIHYGYLLKGEQSWLTFASKRFWRIYPPYVLVLVVFGLATGPFSLYQWLSHLTLTHNLFEFSFFGINPSFWSLALEAQLYLLYPVLILVRRSLGITRTVLALFVLSAFFVSYNAIEGPTDSVFKLSVFRMWVIWGLGALIAERHMNGEKLFKRHVLWLVLLCACIPLVYFSFMRPWLLRYAFMLFHAVLLEWALSKPSFDRDPSRHFLTRLVVGSLYVIGLSSYSFYLIHQPLLGFVHDTLPLAGINGMLVEVLVSFMLIALVSYILYRIIELPSVRLGRRTLRRR